MPKDKKKKKDSALRKFILKRSGANKVTDALQGKDRPTAGDKKAAELAKRKGPEGIGAELGAFFGKDARKKKRR